MNRALRRVLMTGDTAGGVWTFTMELARALGERNIEVMLAALGGLPDESQRAEAAQIPSLTLLGSEWKLEWMNEPWRDVEESGKWLLSLEEKYSPEIVHLNSFGHGALPWRAPTVLTAHSCVLSWWRAVKHEEVPDSWDRYRRQVERSLQHANGITAPTAAMLRSLTENYGSSVSEDRCRVIPNGRRADGFRHRLHEGTKEPLLLAAGRLWDEAKNIAAVGKAAELLPWPVYLAGEQHSPDGASVRVSGCRLLGRLSPDRLADWYARAAIYALPARYEPFGLSVLEAALSGCALVLGDISTLREIWKDAALFVPPEDHQALAGACRELIEDRVMREDFARRAFEVARMFTPARMCSGYLDAYESAMKESYACAS